MDPILLREKVLYIVESVFHIRMSVALFRDGSVLETVEVFMSTSFQGLQDAACVTVATVKVTNT